MNGDVVYWLFAIRKKCASLKGIRRGNDHLGKEAEHVSHHVSSQLSQVQADLHG